MDQKTIPWDEATREDLVKFSAQVLGIPVAPNIGEDTLRAKIRAAYQGDEITIYVPPDTAPDAPDAPGADQEVAATVDNRALRGTSSKADPKVQLTIAETEGAGGKRGVYVGVNGVGMIIPRGRIVDVPYRYYVALSHAVKTVHEQDDDTHEILSTEIPSYPYSVNVMPPQAEIDAYLAAEA